MQIDPLGVWEDLQAIKNSSPLVHNITNYVVMESTANALLAIGASPVMAHALDEVEEMVGIANSLVINIGTLSPMWIKAMLHAIKAAKEKGIPIVLDPVGAGATSYRTETSHALLNHHGVSVIRGNASEISSLCGTHGGTKGVDSLLCPVDCEPQARILADKSGAVVWMSGATDVVTDGHTVIFVENGHPLMTRVTGMGCAASALTGAFLAINPDTLLGTAHAAFVMGIAGEIAAEKCRGPGSFKVEFLDALYSLSLSAIEERIREMSH